MKTIVIYTMNHCPFCEMAKGHLKQLNLPYKEINVHQQKNTDELRLELMNKSGQRTLPQIFIGEHSVGGYTDLIKLSVDEIKRLSDS